MNYLFSMFMDQNCLDETKLNEFYNAFLSKKKSFQNIDSEEHLNNNYSKQFVFEVGERKLSINNQEYGVNVRYEIEFLYSKNFPNHFAVRYILRLDSNGNSLQYYDGILDDSLDDKFNASVKKLNHDLNDVLKEFEKYHYCEYSHKEHQLDSQDKHMYKSRILICTDENNVNNALDLILHMYNEHKKVLNTPNN
jgi:hypothetical protein